MLLGSWEAAPFLVLRVWGGQALAPDQGKSVVHFNRRFFFPCQKISKQSQKHLQNPIAIKHFPRKGDFCYIHTASAALFFFFFVYLSPQLDFLIPFFPLPLHLPSLPSPYTSPSIPVTKHFGLSPLISRLLPFSTS